MTPGHLTYEFAHPPRWNRFLAGLLINAMAIVVLIVSGAHLNVTSLDPIRTKEHVTLVAPVTIQPKIESASAPRFQPPRQLVRVEPPKPLPIQPVRVAPRPAPVEAKRIEPSKIVASALPTPKPMPRAEIKTNVFASAPSQTATADLPARKVQTGGFGDPNGVPPQTGPQRNTVMVASVGSFDLPGGAGRGNGAGGTHGTSGTVRSAGFDEPAAAPKSDDRVLAASGFDLVATAKVSEPKPIAKKAQLQPVEIVYKPRPAYTPEARRLRVEGEVLLYVMFHADGSLHVNRVVKGLGYGLDDMALAAAEQIQFRPARRDGQPYDYAALVHIVFELSK